MLRLSTLAFLLALPNASSAQLVPTIGWDSLRASIHYPEILRRAGVEGAAYVRVYIDSTGSVEDLVINSNFDAFEAMVRSALLPTKWHPENAPNKPRKGAVVLNIHFFIQGERIERRINIETKPVYPMPKVKLK